LREERRRGPLTTDHTHLSADKSEVDGSGPDSARIALRVRGVSKTFPGVRALIDFDLDVRAGSVHALLGHNGCGKSTLIKALAGVHSPDPGGEVWIDDQPLEVGDPEDAERKGLRFVHQDLGIIPEMGAVDNVGFVLGFERGRGGAINWRKQAKQTTELLRRFGFELDPWLPLGEASPPQRAAVAIVRAIGGWQAGRGVLILDEPTAALAANEVDQLFSLIREVSATGTAVILVSHRLDEVMAIADHATVMREGRKIWDGDLSGTTIGDLVDLIANTEKEEQPSDDVARRNFTSFAADAPCTLEVSNLSARYLRQVSFKVRKGEVLGVAGLLGSGREELPYIIAGDLTEGVSGAFKIGDRSLDALSIESARESGVALVPADRGGESIFAEFTTTENVSLAALPQLRQAGAVVPPPAERKFALKWLHAVHADARFAPRPIATLSGGNQQKAILARWLCISPKLLVLAEPTAGVDIGARQIIYEELRRRAADGLSVLMASSDVEDLLASCDRVIALRDGVIAGEFNGALMTKASISYAMEGAHEEGLPAASAA
jgi:ribose transport system ATP-binding protein